MTKIRNMEENMYFDSCLGKFVTKVPGKTKNDAKNFEKGVKWVVAKKAKMQSKKCLSSDSEKTLKIKCWSVLDTENLRVFGVTGTREIARKIKTKLSENGSKFSVKKSELTCEI